MATNDTTGVKRDAYALLIFLHCYGLSFVVLNCYVSTARAFPVMFVLLGNTTFTRTSAVQLNFTIYCLYSAVRVVSV